MAGGRVGRSYAGDAADDYFAYQRAMGDLGAELNRAKFARHIAPTDTVLDFGCGAGGLLRGLPGGDKVGVEASAPARQAANDAGLRAVASLREVADASVDVAISNHALEHTLSPFAELTDLHRVLRPGGKLVLWLPLDDWRSQRRPGDDPDHHLFTWTPLLLRNLLTEAGFEVREAAVVAHAWPPRTALLARLPRRAFDALAVAWSVLRRRRQVMAVAVRPG